VLVACGTMKPGWTGALHQERSFFGTNTVKLSKDGRHRTMEHGTTLHGAERVMTNDGKSVTAPVPATYYYPGSPMQRGIELARKSYVAGPVPFTVGLVGLGTGSLACYAKSGETWRYFEIDPMVARIARNPKLFNFLSTCLPNNEILIGDARLTLKSQPDAGFNYLVIDAFSSDAIPAHLLTREAFAGYLDKLASGGVIAIHISNRYLDLAPSIVATVATLPGLNIAEAFSTPTLEAPDGLRSQVLFVSKNQALIAEAAAWPDGKALAASDATPWTDDYSDVMSALIRKIKE
jgi:spermidine synthase